MSIFAERLKLRRLELGLTQEDIAIAINSTRGQISRYESGDNDPTGQVISRLAYALKVSPNWLLGFSEGMFSSELDENEQELLKLYNSKNHESQKKLLEIAKVV